MYIKISNQLSAGVIEEMKSHERSFTRDAVDSAGTAQDYFLSGNSLVSHYYGDLLSRLPNKPSVVMDVGVGNGQSSVYLAHAGIQCYAVEPDQNLCNLIGEVSKKFALPITVCEGVGEDLANVNKGEFFDAVIFNASLHHCDDPVKALQQAHKVLRPGGKVFLLNESFLRPWVSEAGYQRKLLADPIGMGHYGGNEHAYHNWKYEKMLKMSGFLSVKRLSVQPLDTLSRIDYLMKLKIDGQRVFRYSGILSRLISYKLEEYVRGSGSMFQMLAALSLMPCAFLGEKQ